VTTLTAMKSRIASELRRDDLTSDIADAITSAISAYKYRKFSFNTTTFVDAPATDGEANNAWMTTAERLIRCRAKAELQAHVIKDPERAAELYKLVEEALAELKLSVSNTSTATADTLGAMKLRIANEINRSDLTDEIANAIADAIACYDRERFYFAESRDVTFACVADQARYGAATTTTPTLAIPRILHIDYAYVYIGGNPQRLAPRDPDLMEYDTSGDNASSGTPGGYGWYGEELILDPPPIDTYTVRLGCVLTIAAPSADDTADNPWMMRKHAESLIRNRAKAELYANIEDIMDDAKASKFLKLADEALDKLRDKTEAKLNVGDNVVQAWDPYR
jgi:hypothetical protein